MSRLEILPFLEFAPQYFAYIHSRQTNRRPTLLCKIVGVYKVRYRNTVKGSSFNSNLLVMENLFYNKNISHIFDLKGSVRNRLVDPNSQDGEIVLLDENLIKSKFPKMLKNINFLFFKNDFKLYKQKYKT